jgi:hypothetical protein
MLLQMVRALGGVSSSSRGPLAYLLLAMPIVAAGCNGCNSGNLVCDANGECTICDSYGCHSANPEPNGSTGQGQGGNGQGGGGQGGSGQGGGSTTQTGTGGGPACDPATTTCSCTDVSQCAPGDSCLGGLCLPGCNHDYECGVGKVCANGLCTAGCSTEVTCATGYKCVAGACLVDAQNPQCTGPSDCGGMLCVGGLCTTACKANKDCAPGELCDSVTGSCFPDPTPKPVCTSTCPGAGQVCGADGYCHYSCTTVNACKLIDNRFVACDAGFCKTQEEVSPDCDLTHPCPNNGTCISNKCVP